MVIRLDLGIDDGLPSAGLDLLLYYSFLLPAEVVLGGAENDVECPAVQLLDTNHRLAGLLAARRSGR